MTTTLFTDIQIALETVLDDIPGHPHIHWESDIAYKPPLGIKYWRTQNIGLSDDIVTNGGLHNMQGVYQISIFVPKNGSNEDILQDCNSIFTAYNQSLNLYEGGIRLDILRTPRGPTLVEGNWTQGIMEIYYRVFTH